MKLRRAIIFVLCAVFALALVGCSKGGTDGGDVNGPAGEPHTVYFDVGDAARAAGVQNPADIVVPAGQCVTNLPEPTGYTGYLFAGWFEGTTRFTSSIQVYDDWHLTAKWEKVSQYELNLNWAQPDHFYIHYKRYAHTKAEEGKTNPSAAPYYNDQIDSSVYGDRGLWLWPKNGDGRLFNAMKIDESGAVYDILLTHTYNDAGWNEITKQHKGLTMTYDTADVGMQLFSIASRSEEGFWANDGGNNYLTLADLKRADGSYHWYVTQGNVGKGSPVYIDKDIDNPYKDDDGKKYTSSGNINSNVNNSATYGLAKKAAGYDEVGVGYQIFIASFADGKQDDAKTPKGKGMGDLRGIIDKLEEGYFDKLNVDVLWLTPFQTSTNYHGYDIKDYYSVDSRFGTLADYRELVYKAHKKNIKIVMDFVLNHTAQSNPWFVKSQNLVKEGDIDYRNFYSWINEDQYQSLHNCTPESKKADGHVCAKDQWFKDDYGYYFYSSFSSDMPELNYDYQPVRDAIIDVCNYWMEFGLDGFRLDAVKHIYMHNETAFATAGGADGTVVKEKDKDYDPYAYDLTRNLNFWREFNYRLKANYPNAFIVSENLDGNPENCAPFYCGMDSQFNFNLYYDAARNIVASAQGGQFYGQSAVSRLKVAGTSYTKDFALFNAVNNHFIDGLFTSNHDLPRARDRMNITTDCVDDDFRSFFSDTGTVVKVTDKNGQLVNDTFTDKLGKHTRYTYQDSSTNPTVNSTTKERAEKSEKLLRMYYAYNMTMPGVSWIYYGDELGMTGNMDVMINVGLASGAGAHEDRIYRQPMKWKDTVADNASYLIGFETYKNELVGLNTTEYVHGADYQDTHDGTILKWMQLLTKVRNDHPELINGKMTLDESAAPGTLVYTVSGGGNTTKVFMNVNSSSMTISGQVYASWNLSGTSLGQYGIAICKG